MVTVALGTPYLLDTLPVTDGGLDAVRDTLKKMAAIVRKYKTDVTTLTAARGILTSSGITDVRSQRRLAIAALQGWVRDRIAYVYDPNGAEMLQTPPRTLSIGTGDCDDKVILLLAMLESIGFDTELLAVGGVGAGWDPGCAPQSPGESPSYSHVLGAVKFGKPTGQRPWFLDGWLTLETIVSGAPPGYMPPGVRVVMPWVV